MPEQGILQLSFVMRSCGVHIFYYSFIFNFIFSPFIVIPRLNNSITVLFTQSIIKSLSLSKSLKLTGKNNDFGSVFFPFPTKCSFDIPHET